MFVSGVAFVVALNFTVDSFYHPVVSLVNQKSHDRIESLRAKAYIRASTPGWPVERQETLLRASLQEIKDWVHGPVYRDMVSANTLKSGPAVLTERASLLRPTGRRSQETIYVASMACFAISLRDLVSALGQAHTRNATVVSVFDGVEVPPGATPDVMALAVEAFDRGRRRQQTEAGRLVGVEAAARKKRDRTAEAIEAVRADWRKPTSDITTEEIASKSGLSVKTLYSKLGRRSDAQKRSAQSTRRKAAKP